MPSFYHRTRQGAVSPQPIDAAVLVEMAATGNVHPEDQLRSAAKDDAPWREAWRYRELFPPDVCQRYERASTRPLETATTAAHSEPRPNRRRLLLYTGVAGVALAAAAGYVYWSGKRAHRIYFNQLLAYVEHVKGLAGPDRGPMKPEEALNVDAMLKELRRSYDSLWPWQKSPGSAKFFALEESTNATRLEIIVPPKPDAADPRGSFERLYGFYTRSWRVSEAQEKAAAADSSIALGTLKFASWDVRKTDSLKDPLQGEAVGTYSHPKLGDYHVGVSFIWREGRWLAKGVSTRWSGERGFDSPDNRTAVKAVGAIIAELGLPTAAD